MANKKRYATGSRAASTQKSEQDVRSLRLLLALTLVPLVIGGLLILGWALDIYLWDNAITQIYVGLLFILASFALSNGLQKYWYAAVGWVLLAISDLLLLVVVNLFSQLAAFVIGAAGLLMLGMEFYRRWHKQSAEQHGK
jgi:hypothetical protein